MFSNVTGLMNVDIRAVKHLNITHRDQLSGSQNRRLIHKYTDPKINRWTGEPHEHKREIARRERQAKIKDGTHPWRGRNPR